MLDTGVYNLLLTAATLPAAAAIGDYIVLATIGRAAASSARSRTCRHARRWLRRDTGALSRRRARAEPLTAASTASGGKHHVTGVALANVDAQAGDEIVIVVSGANVGAASASTVDVHLQH
jgi:hypothetical protein